MALHVVVVLSTPRACHLYYLLYYYLSMILALRIYYQVQFSRKSQPGKIQTPQAGIIEILRSMLFVNGHIRTCTSNIIVMILVFFS